MESRKWVLLRGRLEPRKGTFCALFGSAKKVLFSVSEAWVQHYVTGKGGFSVTLSCLSLAQLTIFNFTIDTNFAAAMPLQFDVGDHAAICCNDQL